MALAKNHGRDVNFCFNRKEAKTHGEGGNLVGAPLKGRVLVVDDVITAGTAINEAVDIINAQPDAKLEAVVIALDRQERASEESPESAIMQVEKRLGIKVLTVYGGRAYEPQIEALEKAIAELTPRRRVILLAARLQGMPQREIASRLGVSLRLVEKELRLAQEHCARKLGK